MAEWHGLEVPVAGYKGMPIPVEVWQEDHGPREAFYHPGMVGHGYWLVLDGHPMSNALLSREDAPLWRYR